MISTGGDHACALGENGAAVCWGDEDAQQDRPEGDERYIAIGAGSDFTCALRMDGSPTCWGLDNKWKDAAPGYERFVYLSVARDYACALHDFGTAVCWDEDGVITSDDYSGLNPPLQERSTHISAGSSHVCGVRADGYPVCWGSNWDGKAAPPQGTRLAAAADLQEFARQLDALLMAGALPATVAQVVRSVARVEVPTGEYSSNLGTGVIVSIDAETGTAELLTAYHVVQEAEMGIVVTAEDEGNVKEYDAVIIAFSAAKDIARLSICCSPTFQAAELLEGLPDVGESVFVIGYGGHENYASIRPGKTIGMRETFGRSEIGVDAEVIKGDSGGPLVLGRTGEVIGIVLAISIAPNTYEWWSLDEDLRELYQQHFFKWAPGTGIVLSSSDAADSVGLAGA